MQFYLTRNQSNELQNWKKQFTKVNYGPIGGQFSYNFVVENGKVVDKFIEFCEGDSWQPNKNTEDLSPVETIFEFTESQLNRASVWINEQQLTKVTYRTIPTTMGNTLNIVTKDGRKIDLSDYDNWG
jgi:hypothetical protein